MNGILGNDQKILENLNIMSTEAIPIAARAGNSRRGKPFRTFHANGSANANSAICSSAIPETRKLKYVCGGSVATEKRKFSLGVSPEPKIPYIFTQDCSNAAGTR